MFHNITIIPLFLLYFWSNKCSRQ